MTLLSSAIFIFIVVAILYYQSQTETFVNVPADLNRAPNNAVPIASLPKSSQIIQSPGINTNPPEALATQQELQALDDIITTWLVAASSAERSNPAALTPEQKQERVLLQAQRTSVRNQIASGLIVDTFRSVQEDSKRIQSENTSWGKTTSQLDSVDSFAKSSPDGALLTPDQYREFRGLFEAGYSELKGYIQPEPLQRVRLQQIQVMRSELDKAERNKYPPIQVGNARLFLQNMLKPDQPLPSLMSISQMEEFSNIEPKASNTDSVLRDLRDIQWKLQHQNNPVLDESIEMIGDAIHKLQSWNASVDDINNARIAIVDVQNMLSPGAFPGTTLSPIQIRAQSICQNVHRAFPEDAIALGCPAEKQPMSKYRSQEVIHTVCDRIRYSVPTVSTEQFNCPVTK